MQVRDESTDDHMTTELCMNEIKNCQRLSMGPNFVVFLGQKYGYRPIPTYILTSELMLIRDELIGLNADASLLEMWYKKDSNAVPPISVLQPISSILVNFNNKVDMRSLILINGRNAKEEGPNNFPLIMAIFVVFSYFFSYLSVASAEAAGRRSGRLVGHIGQNAKVAAQSGRLTAHRHQIRQGSDAQLLYVGYDFAFPSTKLRRFGPTFAVFPLLNCASSSRQFRPFSVTEREVINGILNVKNTKNHCLAYVRYINNINLQNLKKASLFVDIINRSLDTEAAKLLANLRDERLPDKIETTNMEK